VSSDFADLLSEFAAASVRYLLVGGHAVAFHAEPRFTKDLDLWVEPTPENARRVMVALTRFGAPLQGISADDFSTPGTVFQIGVAPNRVDVLTQISGVTFAEAWPGRVSSRYGVTPVWVIGRKALAKNKSAVGRPQDVLDVQALRRAPPSKRR